MPVQHWCSCIVSCSGTGPNTWMLPFLWSVIISCQTSGKNGICPSWGGRTLDSCYSPLKRGWKANSLPSFLLSNHTTMFFRSKYKHGGSGSCQEMPYRRLANRYTEWLDCKIFKSSADMISGSAAVKTTFIAMLSKHFHLYEDCTIFSEQLADGK